MDERTPKIALACFISGWLGLFLAIQVRPIFWWVGLIVGAGAAYLIYEFRKVLWAIPRAWALASGAISSKWRYAFRDAFAVFVTLTNLWPVAFLLFSGLVWPQYGIRGLASAAVATMIAVLVATIGFSILIGVASFTLFVGGMDIKLHSPLRVYGHYLPQVVRLILTEAPGILAELYAELRVAARVFGRFLWYLVRLIYSEERLLCMFHTALGITVGYWYFEHVFFGIMGGVLGALFGVVSFEILSKRGLHVVPLRSR